MLMQVAREYPYDNLKAELGGSFGMSRFTDGDAAAPEGDAQPEEVEE